MPRSPSRDLSDRHNGSRGYFRRAGWVTRLKLGLAIAGLALTAACAVLDARYPAHTARTHSPGELSSPHSAWASHCAACHVEFSVKDFGPLSVFRAGQRWQSVTCENCHAGPAHHATVDTDGAEFHARCANCHKEHGGRLNSLLRVPDQQCVRCHENLPTHRAGDGHVSPTVTGFAHDHPEFRLLARQQNATSYEKRTLKFSHGLHMTPGLVYRDGAKGSWTLERLAELSGEHVARRYQKPGQSLDSPVSLDCASCHSTEAVPAGNRIAPRTDGTYYQPVRFDAHCKSCHPVRAPAAVSGSVAVPAFDLPHGVQPTQLTEQIAGEYSRRMLDAKNPFAATPLGPVGRFDPRSNPVLATYRSEIDRLAAIAVNVLVTPVPPPDPDTPQFAPAGGVACGKCHDLSPSVGKSSLPTITPIATPAVWFPDARFNHAAHRGVSCVSCHPGTTAALFGTGWVTEKEPIRIAGVASCQQCHGPPRTAFDAEGVQRQLGGAKHTCTDCHMYHNGDHPLQGRGAGARKPHRLRNTADFMHNP